MIIVLYATSTVSSIGTKRTMCTTKSMVRSISHLDDISFDSERHSLTLQHAPCVYVRLNVHALVQGYDSVQTGV